MKGSSRRRDAISTTAFLFPAMWQAAGFLVLNQTISRGKLWSRAGMARLAPKLILACLEASQPLQHERRYQGDQRDGEQRCRHRTLHQRQGITEADLKRSAQLALGDRAEDETDDDRRDREIEPAHQETHHAKTRQHRQFDD